ncbi:MAG: hypothetical protein P8P49_06395 [Opitutales bacterium]|nr:hypothetical protein [Opitutales bacterium]MDG1325377.1 hypothetical protein [Opitutales bacterium]
MADTSLQYVMARVEAGSDTVEISNRITLSVSLHWYMMDCRVGYFFLSL